MVKQPDICQGCSEWEKECKDIFAFDPTIIYPVVCGYCENEQLTCWKAILPDGWRITSPVVEGLLCWECEVRFHDFIEQVKDEGDASKIYTFLDYWMKW